jgi:hypothetical protein
MGAKSETFAQQLVIITFCAKKEDFGSWGRIETSIDSTKAFINRTYFRTYWVSKLENTVVDVKYRWCVGKNTKISFNKSFLVIFENIKTEVSIRLTLADILPKNEKWNQKNIFVFFYNLFSNIVISQEKKFTIEECKK